MTRLGLCVLLPAARAGPADSPAATPPAAALVAGEPAPPAARLDDARRRLAARYRLVGDRELLEASPDAAAVARAALERAHQRLRRFDVAAVGAALGDARAAVELLPSG